MVWRQFKKHPIGLIALFFFSFFCLIAIYAPFLASSKPLFLIYRGEPFFPLFRYLFYTGFFTKALDIFYNVLIFAVPLGLILFFSFKGYVRRTFLVGLFLITLALFGLFAAGFVKNPASDLDLLAERQKALAQLRTAPKDPTIAGFRIYPDWDFDLKFMNSYERINLLLKQKQRFDQQLKLQPYENSYRKKTGRSMPTLWAVDQKNGLEEKNRLEHYLKNGRSSYDKNLLDFSEILSRYQQLDLSSKNPINSTDAVQKDLLVEVASLKQTLTLLQENIQRYRDSSAKLNYLKQRQEWITEESSQLSHIFNPLLRSFHWEDDAGGEQASNLYLPWWELSRINRKDLLAALIFGTRISLMVGITAVTLALCIGVPTGLFSGYFAGRWDMVICRLIEIWEAMPVFFMLLLIVAITESKSIFLIICILGIFGWTSFSRYMRAEVFKQRNLSYVLACHSLGYSHQRIMFSHILPNAIPPVLTLLPFAMMSAITSEAALAFLGLGDAGSCSWGVLMDEGRSVFPAESYLLWPPAILLTILLINIALIGDTIRDALDPKMQ